MTLPVLLIGGGMISQEVILPTLFQERRKGLIGEIVVSAHRARTIQHLRELFPEEQFIGLPEPERFDSDEPQDYLYRQALEKIPKGSAVIVATPDNFHTEIILDAINNGHHLVVQKPLCLKTAEAHQIIESAEKSGAYVLTDYHKRHDPAIRAAKYKFGRGELGQMLHGHAWIEERREIPLKWFARWCEESSPFEYIGVHYVDAYFFITGLKPRRVAAFGQKKLLPGLGKDAFDAVQAVIEWEDGSTLWVQTAWVCSEYNSALTNQGLQLLGTEGEYWADHKDRNCHFVTQTHGYEDYNPNFFKTFDSWDPDAQFDVRGYGYDSIVQGLYDIQMINSQTAGLSADDALTKCKEIIAKLAPKRALPHQALIGTAVIEAARMSIKSGNAYIGFDEAMRPVILP